MRWVKIQSWHEQSGLVSRGGLIRTTCGRWAQARAETSDDLPAEKSCEVCLRIVARRADG